MIIVRNTSPPIFELINNISRVCYEYSKRTPIIGHKHLNVIK